MNVLDDSISVHTFSADARARSCVVERESELFCASPSACGLHMPDALGEPTAHVARAECSLRGEGATLGCLGRDMGLPATRSNPMPRHSMHSTLFLVDECPGTSFLLPWTW